MSAPRVRRENLTPQMVRECLSYDPQTGLLSWTTTRCGRGLAGAVTGSPTVKGYLRVRIFRNSYQSHRLIWFMVFGEWPAQIDHINGDKTDNRLVNLRLANTSQNQHNKVCKGYYLNRQTGRYLVRTTVNGRRIFLGEFESEEDASRVYLTAHAKYHGEYSFTQRPAGGQTSRNLDCLPAPSSPTGA